MMNDELQLNVALLKRRVPNLTTAARAAGLRPATVSNLCTGKIPIGRAEVKTLVILASLANCSLDELILRGSGISMLETGIKMLDLFAPVVRGGTVGIVARPGMGQLVLMPELFYRVRKRGYVTLFWKPKEDAKGIIEVEQEADIVCGTLDEVYENILKQGHQKDIMLGADRSIVLSGEWLTLKEKLQEAGSRPITTVLVDILGEAVDEEAPYGPLDTLLKLDMDLTSRKLFPAVDVISSTSTLLEGAQLEATHLMIGQRARKLLRRYKELRSLVQVHGIDKLADSDQSTYQRGEKLEAFLTQPFYFAEPYTKKPGEWLPLQDTLDGVRRILDGAADDLEVSELSYIGRLAAQV